jgi:ADP-L-glycero-D-manno-heptose 6-epimerase
MKILLTGHNGFIGSHMLKALSGHEVATYEWGDTYRHGVMGFDWVIHLGAISSTTERDIEKVLTQNLDFSINLYDECKTFGVNFQYASSASIYGLVSTFSEDAPPDPRTPYAWSKYLFERYVRTHPSGSIVQGFRYFNVYGPDGEGHKGSQASPYYQFAKQAKETNSIKLFKNSDKYLRDFIHVDELVATQLKFLNVKESGIWNVGTGNTKSFADVAKTFNVKLIEIPMPAILTDSYQKYTCADRTKLNETLAKLNEF